MASGRIISVLRKGLGSMSEEAQKQYQALTDRKEKREGVDMFKVDYLVDDCQLRWQGVHELLYLSAKEANEQLGGIGGDVDNTMRSLRKEAKDSLYVAMMQSVDKDRTECSYENLCVKTSWTMARKCDVTHSLAIPSEVKAGVQASKARCSILLLGSTTLPMLSELYTNLYSLIQVLFAHALLRCPTQAPLPFHPLQRRGVHIAHAAPRNVCCAASRRLGLLPEAAPLWENP